METTSSNSCPLDWYTFLAFSICSTHLLYLFNCSLVFGELNLLVFGELSLFNSILIYFILKEKRAVPYWSHPPDVNCKIWNLPLMINTVQHIFWFPFRMALRPGDEIEVILDGFLCTLHSTASAVTTDTDVVRVNRF